MSAFRIIAIVLAVLAFVFAIANIAGVPSPKVEIILLSVAVILLAIG